MSYSQVTEPAAVRAELERIVASPPFEEADRLVRFLTFVVEQTLAGRGGMLKESVIGTEVFGREPGYDPKTDPIVRVQARRLRAKLDAWYQEGGQASAVRIALPKGGYEPEFGPVAHVTVEPSPALPEPAKPSLPSSKRPYMWLAAAAAAIAIASGVLLLTRSKPSPAVQGSRPFTAYPGYQTSPAFSPDGQTLAFCWGGGSSTGSVGVYVQPLTADSPRRLTNSNTREHNPVWLPDGQHIAFLRDDGLARLAVIVASVLGSGERRVAQIAADPAAAPGIDWSRDGRKLYSSESPAPGEPSEVVEIDLESGARRWISPPIRRGPAAGTPGDDDVHVSPDGKSIAFRRRTASAVGDVFVAPVSGGTARAITHDQTGVAGIAWTKDGDALIISSQRQSGFVRLWRFPLDGSEPTCLTDAALSASFPAVSPRDGQIAFASRFFNTNIYRIDLQGEAAPQLLVASNLLDSCPRYSPQGDRIAFRTNRTGADEIWTADAAGHSPVRLTTFGGPVTGSPHWSPDGQSIAFDSRPDGSADIFVIPAGGGRFRKLTRETSNEVTPSFSSDGKSIYFASDRTGAWQIWTQPVDGGPARQVTTAGGFAPQPSADGQWLYYAKMSGGVFRVPAGGGAETAVLSLPPGSWGGWTHSGANLLYVTQPTDAAPAQLQSFDPESGKTRTLTNLPYPPVQWDGALAVSPDGRYALVSVVQRQGSEIHLQPDR